MKAFNAKDGYGLNVIARNKDIEPIIITGRKSQIVENRCRELNISKVYQGVHDKVAKLKDIVEESRVDTVAYIGDDLNDLACMKYVKSQGGLVGCPADAAKEVLQVADFISTRNGGDGAVREFIEWLI